MNGMAVAVSRPSAWVAGRQSGAPAGMRRQMIGTMLAGLILGLGGVTIGTSLVQASERGGIFGFLEEIFRPQRAAVEPVPTRPARYARLPDARRIARPRIVPHTPRPVLAADIRRTRPRRHRASVPPPAATGQRTVCVRMCDGYLFPLGNLRSQSDLPVHQAACAAACPNADTRLYTVAAGEWDHERAFSPQGVAYRGSALANVYRERRVANCSCQPPGAAIRLPIARDATVRTGDVVATTDGADVITRIRGDALVVTDFRHARLGRHATRDIEAKVGVLRREELARVFRRGLRQADRGVVRVASGGFTPRADDAVASVRVVTPSPYMP